MASSSSNRRTRDAEPSFSSGESFAGKYRVVRVLGQGGMATVIEAHHVRLGHRVAIKVLSADLLEEPDLLTRFDREARAASALTSKHAVRILDIDVTEDGTPFIVMEPLSGYDLAAVLEREGPQPVARAVRWILEASDALAEAHRLGIVHRDLKPSNLFQTDAGVKVLDFGIAKQTGSREVSITQVAAPLGTPQYMSPEQIRTPSDIDGRADIWSLGVTLYELLTGTPPFAAASAAACIASVCVDPIPDPRVFREELPDDLVDVLMKMLEKDVAERFASIEAVVLALTPFADEERSKAPIVSDCATLAEPSPVVERPKAPSPARPRSPVSSVAVGFSTLLAAAALVVVPKCVSLTPASAAATPLVGEAMVVRPAPAFEPESVLLPVPGETATDGESEGTPAEGRPETRHANVRRPAPERDPMRLVAGEAIRGGLSGPGF